MESEHERNENALHQFSRKNYFINSGGLCRWRRVISIYYNFLLEKKTSNVCPGRQDRTRSPQDSGTSFNNWNTGQPIHRSTCTPQHPPAPRSGFLRQVADYVVSSTTTSWLPHLISLQFFNCPLFRTVCWSKDPRMIHTLQCSLKSGHLRRGPSVSPSPSPTIPLPQPLPPLL